MINYCINNLSIEDIYKNQTKNMLQMVVKIKFYSKQWCAFYYEKAWSVHYHIQF